MTDAKDLRVFLSGHIDVPANRLDAVRVALPDHIALTRAEPGCLSFDVVEDANIAGRFTVAEVFTTQAAFDAHQTRTKASDWFTITQGIPREYSVSVGAPIST
ncbi:putative quinol monooxygenase [Shimia abyssi]|uniref:Quinol monooxygenase YgiN n=1 Tax=Shimia abyssi TaxID=1662395 RepID=A0A2P8FG33_9RHOB|nr:putative quinol monooxygenase [Shimia abyssi]PSL20674.1 quinol monooxygenase YgiN [Shimia abyssi]